MSEEKEKLPFGMHLTFDEENHLFVISFVEDNKAIFQVKMCPPAFEKMSADIVRTIKNYNLYQIEQMNERLNEEKSKITEIESSGRIEDLSSANRSNQIK